jgi:hypothetical protein
MPKNFFFITIILFILSIINLLSQVGEKKNLDFYYEHYNSIIYISGGFVLFSESQNFFDQYKNVLDGTKSDFNFFPLASVGTKFQLWKSFRTGFDIELSYAQMKEAYTRNLKITLDGYRSYSQTIRINSIPVIFIFEFIPIQKQFRTYSGVGIGFVYRNITWNELIISSDPYDKRKDGQHYNETEIIPATRIYAGLDLGFDKEKIEKLLSSFFIEIRYTCSYRKLSIFNSIEKQFTEVPSKIFDKTSIIPGYLGLYFGLSFNFKRRY